MQTETYHTQNPLRAALPADGRGVPAVSVPAALVSFSRVGVAVDVVVTENVRVLGLLLSLLIILITG